MGIGQPNGAILKTLWTEGPDCWLWIGCINKTTGYGKKTWHGKEWSAHRWMYTQRVGPIPKGKIIGHACNIRHCVNPDHLKAMTQSENIQQCMDQGRHPNKGKKLWGINANLIINA